MKQIILAITLLVIVSLVACTNPTTQAQTVPSTTPPTIPTHTTAGNPSEEAEIRNLVKSFGKRLQKVSLLAPDAAQELQQQYSEFVSPTLLELWMSDVSNAPGRVVSSPWPDRIEIATLAKESSDKYEITGFVVEITSTEVNSSAAADRIPVRLLVQRAQGRWLITEYAAST